MRRIDFLTWNTQLYEMGNIIKKGKPIKKVDMNIFGNIIVEIKNFLNMKNDAIAILQEIPYMCNENNEFKEHVLFTEFIKEFQNEKYFMFYNISSPKQIKMTVVLANRVTYDDWIFKNDDGLNNNMCVSFGIKNIDLTVIGVHSHNAIELLKWLKNLQQLPDILIGDFNAGDYKKKYENNRFILNRKSYTELLDAYDDICNGQNTRKFVFPNGYVYETPIDHILIKKNNNLINKSRCRNDVKINSVNDDSDHYPVYFKLLL